MDGFTDPMDAQTDLQSQSSHPFLDLLHGGGTGSYEKAQSAVKHSFTSNSRKQLRLIQIYILHVLLVINTYCIASSRSRLGLNGNSNTNMIKNSFSVHHIYTKQSISAGGQSGALLQQLSHLLKKSPKSRCLMKGI